MSFFSELIADAENALAAAQPVIQIAETVVPAVEAAFPASAPIINAVTAGAASISAVVPGAVASTTNIITGAKSLIASGSAEIKQLEAMFSALFTKHNAGQVTVLAPATTAATVSTPAT